MTLLLDAQLLFTDILKTDISESIKIRIQAILQEIDTQIPQNSKDGISELIFAVNELGKISTPDIDAIIPLVERGMSGYRACAEKIAKVDDYLKLHDATGKS